MKTKEQIQEEIEYTDVFTIEEFAEQVNDGLINSFDGYGYLHDGVRETRINVWDETLTYEDVIKYPYVCWYNK